MEKVINEKGQLECVFSSLEVLMIVKCCFDRIIREDPACTTPHNPWSNNPDPVYRCLQKQFTELTGHDCSQMPVGLLSAKTSLAVGPGYTRQGQLVIEFHAQPESCAPASGSPGRAAPQQSTPGSPGERRGETDKFRGAVATGIPQTRIKEKLFVEPV